MDLRTQIENLHGRVLRGEAVSDAELVAIVREARASREGAVERATRRVEAQRQEVDLGAFMQGFGKQ